MYCYTNILHTYTVVTQTHFTHIHNLNQQQTIYNTLTTINQIKYIIHNKQHYSLTTLLYNITSILYNTT